MSSIVPDHNFQQFLEKLISRDHESWNSLDFVLRRIITNWLLKNYGQSQFFDATEIEEVYQDAFSKLFEIITGESNNPAEFSSFAKLKSYSVGIAKNMANQKLRKSKRSNQKTHSLDSDHYIWMLSDNDRYAQPAHIEDQDFVETMIKDLDDRERMILKRYSEGDKLVDISRELGISAEHCRIIKHRTLKKMSDKLNNIELNNES